MAVGETDEQIRAADAETLHKMGYAQELSRRMDGFSNFAVAFSPIIGWIVGTPSR